jgi:nucleoside-diphosphate-sugar epimerase
MDRVRPDVLLHLAWNVDTDYETSGDNDRWVQWSLHLAREFIRAGGRHMLVAGSCAEYEWSSPVLCEESRCVPVTRYGIAKLSLSRQVRSFTKVGVKVAWPRLFFLFGEGERDQRLIPHLIRDVRDERMIDWVLPEIRRDYLHVGEAARAIVHLIDRGYDGVINVGSGQAPALEEIAATIAEALGKAAPAITRVGQLSCPTLEIRADISRLRRLGWSPLRTVADALTDLARESVPER